MNEPKKEGDIFTDEYGEFRVAMDIGVGSGCQFCNHKPYPCTKMGCTTSDNRGKGFILLTELNYITHRLTK